MCVYVCVCVPLTPPTSHAGYTPNSTRLCPLGDSLPSATPPTGTKLRPHIEARPMAFPRRRGKWGSTRKEARHWIIQRESSPIGWNDDAARGRSRRLGRPIITHSPGSSV